MVEPSLEHKLFAGPWKILPANCAQGSNDRSMGRWNVDGEESDSFWQLLIKGKEKSCHQRNPLPLPVHTLGISLKTRKDDADGERDPCKRRSDRRLVSHGIMLSDLSWDLWVNGSSPAAGCLWRRRG